MIGGNFSFSGILMVMMLTSLISRNGLRVAKALTTTQNPSRLLVAPTSAAIRFRSSKLQASVEEDLDQALTSFLEDNQQKSAPKTKKVFTDVVPPRKQAAHLEPVTLSDLVEDKKEEEVDYNDPKFLNIKNPFWVENGLDERIIDILSEKGISQFTPVQGEAYLPVKRRRDVIGRSRTGTGKTLAFGLPGLARIVEHSQEKGSRNERGQMQRGRPVSMVILCPTRELARQVSEELSLVARPLGLYVDVFHGGVSYDPQARALRQGLDVLVGTPGRVIDHIKRGNLDLSHCDIAVLDEADEMLNMGFAEDVEIILDGIGSANEHKTQCLLFSATTPGWVKQIGARYQDNVYSIDATGNEGARVATTVTHKAIQLPPGVDAKKQALEDIIAVEISRNMDESEEEDLDDNPIAAAAREKKKSTGQAMQQKIFGKTIVFTETKREADELVSGGVFKTLSAQAIHGDVGQKQRDATLNAFRKGAFNVLVATDVAARGIDISDVDLVIQFDPPRDVDTYVHRSGRTGRAGNKGASVLLFGRQQSRDIVRIERDLGHGFKFELVGPPSIEAAMRAAAKTSAQACMGINEDAVKYFRDAAAELLDEAENPEDIVARCLAAISRRSTDIQSRSLITGELGYASVQMSYTTDKQVTPGDVMFTVGKLSRLSSGDMKFDSDVGKIQTQAEDGTAIFDLGVEDAKRLVEFSNQEGVDTFDAEFNFVQELEVTRDRFFGQPFRGRDNRRGGGNYGRGGGGYRGGGGGGGYRWGWRRWRRRPLPAK
ncbi:dependent RNA helicase [Seminavis robusta]|uniref:Dependent RNA helicase n=1 Tax=Seminavis robusta TaxID=568900 RepID=A0A9N8HU04_9STRA|nr:dependent RNA helicase [Seminavis robusta]|eukprot:Sro1581_g283790.1 dependent RNA helicase (772) ;mRNA; r:8122-10821